MSTQDIHRRRTVVLLGAALVAVVSIGVVVLLDSPTTQAPDPLAATTQAQIAHPITTPQPPVTTTTVAPPTSTTQEPSTTTSPPAAPSVTSSAPTSKPTRSSTAVPETKAPQEEVLALVNRERAAHGCSPVKPNETLRKAAQGHSVDMAERGFFDHTNPDGVTPSERVTAAGYKWRNTGENIAAGQQTAEEVMTSWMNSPGHRANILNCAFTELGVGVDRKAGTEYGIYWTQSFGSR